MGDTAEAKGGSVRVTGQARECIGQIHAPHKITIPSKSNRFENRPLYAIHGDLPARSTRQRPTKPISAIFPQNGVGVMDINTASTILPHASTEERPGID